MDIIIIVICMFGALDISMTVNLIISKQLAFYSFHLTMFNMLCGLHNILNILNMVKQKNKLKIEIYVCIVVNY